MKMINSKFVGGPAPHQICETELDAGGGEECPGCTRSTRGPNRPNPLWAKRAAAERRGKFGAGMTMLELVIGIALFLIISLGIVILIDAYRSYSSLLPEGIFRAGVRRIHSETLEDIKQSIRQSERILATTTIDSADYTTGTTTLALRLRSVDAANNLIPGSYDQIVYYTNTTTPPITLYKRIAGASGSKRTSSSRILNELVEGLVFTYNTSTPRDATSIEIALVTMRKIVPMNVRASSTIRAALR